MRQKTLRVSWSDYLSAKSGYVFYINYNRLLESRDLPETREYEVIVESLPQNNEPLLFDILKAGNLEVLLFRYLKTWKPSILSAADLKPENQNQKILLETNFRTKNLPLSLDIQPNFRFFSDLEKDPHIYCKLNGKKVILLIDPRWITSSSGVVILKSGTVRLSVIGVLVSVRETEAYVSPLIISA